MSTINQFLSQLWIQQPTFSLLVAMVVGCCVGSFLNVLCYRLPIMILSENETEQRFDLAQPASHCPSCKSKVIWWQNIPLISYLLLRGRCKVCHARIPLHYFLVELLAGLIPLICVWQFSWSPQAATASVFCWILLALTIIDLQHKLLPDLLTLGLMWVGLGISCFNVWLSAESAIFGAISGYLLLWGVYQLHFRLTGREGMGYGDFKLLAALGAWLGWTAIPSIILLSSVLGIIGAMALMVVQRNTTQDSIAFGPYLALASIFILFTNFEVSLWLHSILK